VSEGQQRLLFTIAAVFAIPADTVAGGYGVGFNDYGIVDAKVNGLIENQR